ncbi:Pyridoxal phosphate-dependent transferase, major domain protein [Metarhizium rileyi]|uniref:Pyridoxal phosphate-dependent transferase, major domain protein n=1 Tax=Metarhizium rileyi (strain RCEF 4871) TaxID=1649241 RepID=A0A167CKX5_METRR|nr:Pyridoxal phosphate-dependent transferase, major domain protein [Metarhizium rileyi RCEF 4871]
MEKILVISSASDTARCFTPLTLMKRAIKRLRKLATCRYGLTSAGRPCVLTYSPGFTSMARILARPLLRNLFKHSSLTSQRFKSTMEGSGKIRPAARVSNQKQDVWSIINEAAAASPKQPIVNMGQGFFGYNPPEFILNAAKDALDRVECNQYSPTKGRPRLRKAIADAYAPFWGRKIDPETEVTITTGANEGMLSAFMAFIEPGDEVIVFEPFFDQYISNIEMPGGKIVYVPMHPPESGATKTSSAADWTIDFDELTKAITPRTKMIVLNTPHNPVGKVYSREELQKIGDLCVKNDIIILSDEVYDRLYYVPFTRMSTLSPEIEKLTITVGSAGKNFYATGWRVGWLMGPANLIKYVSAAHTRICYSSVSPLQEACAVGFEQAESEGFWAKTITDMKSKMDRFNEIWAELGLPYSEPEGGYFVLVNMSKVNLPADYPFPEHVASRPRDFKMAWFLIQEVGVAAIPPTEFYTDANAHLAEDYVRFAVCKDDEVLEEAKRRLRGLKKYMG